MECLTSQCNLLDVTNLFWSFLDELGLGSWKSFCAMLAQSRMSDDEIINFTDPTAETTLESVLLVANYFNIRPRILAKCFLRSHVLR